MFVKLFSKLLGRDLSFDERIPAGVLLRLYLSKFFSLIYGIIRLRTMKIVFVHPTSKIKCRSKIRFGNGFNVERNCYIDALSSGGLFIGENVSLGYSTYIRVSGSYRSIGNRIKIGNNVGLGTHGYYGCGVGYLTIGNDCIFGNYVSIHPESHNYEDNVLPIRLQGVSSVGGVCIGNNCWIGAKATILDGTKIGDGCIIAAGAVVKGEFPDNVIIGGVPAKIIKHR